MNLCGASQLADVVDEYWIWISRVVPSHHDPQLGTENQAHSIAWSYRYLWESTQRGNASARLQVLDEVGVQLHHQGWSKAKRGYVHHIGRSDVRLQHVVVPQLQAARLHGLRAVYGAGLLLHFVR